MIIDLLFTDFHSVYCFEFIFVEIRLHRLTSLLLPVLLILLINSIVGYIFLKVNQIVADLSIFVQYQAHKNGLI